MSESVSHSIFKNRTGMVSWSTNWVAVGVAMQTRLAFVRTFVPVNLVDFVKKLARISVRVLSQTHIRNRRCLRCCVGSCAVLQSIYKKVLVSGRTETPNQTRGSTFEQLDWETTPPCIAALLAFPVPPHPFSRSLHKCHAVLQYLLELGNIFEGVFGVFRVVFCYCRGFRIQ